MQRPPHQTGLSPPARRLGGEPTLAELRSAVQSARSRPPLGPPALNGSRGQSGRTRAALIAAVAVTCGAIPMLTGSEPYVATARFALRETLRDPDVPEALRSELITHVSDTFGSLASGSSLLRWEVSRATSDQPIVVTVVGQNRPAVRAATDSLARGFLTRLARISRQADAGLPPAETALRDVASSLRGQVDGALRGSAPGSATDDDAFNRRDELTEQLNRWRTAFAAMQDELGRAELRRVELLSAPPAASALISPEVRRRAFEDDAGLTQDLAELGMKAGDLRAEVVSVGELCVPLMQSLEKSAAGLYQAASTRAIEPLGAARQAQVDRIAEATDSFQLACAKFAAEWSTVVSSLRKDSAEIAAATVLAAHENASRLVGDFLFEAGSLLTQMRGALRSLEQTGDEGGLTGAEQARLQSAAAGLSAAFHALQAAFHRYEFAAARMQAANNVRLDAALKSSRGLHRRVAQAMQTIEQRLAADALREAQQARDADLRALDQTLADLRRQLSERIHELLALEDELIANHLIAEEFVRRSAHSDALRGSADAVNLILADLTKRLDGLSQQRSVRTDPAAVTYLGCTVRRAPTDLGKRIITGWLVASAALGVLVAVPWGWQRVARRATRPDRTLSG